MTACTTDIGLYVLVKTGACLAICALALMPWPCPPQPCTLLQRTAHLQLLSEVLHLCTQLTVVLNNRPAVTHNTPQARHKPPSAPCKHNINGMHQHTHWLSYLKISKKGVCAVARFSGPQSAAPHPPAPIHNRAAASAPTPGQKNDYMRTCHSP